jgi:cell division protein FtsL
MKRMRRAQRFIQAYATTPWRRQVQVIGLFSAFVVVVALVASAYLWVSSLAATYGRQVQEIQSTAQVVEDNIEDLNSALGELTTTERMQQLAEEQGYTPMTPWELEYLVVSGFPEEQPLVIAPGNRSLQVEGTQELPPEFTQSLIDWVRETIFKIGLETGASAPDGGGR